MAPDLERLARMPCPIASLASSGIPVTLANEAALRQALEAAGVEFIDENGGGPGVRLRKPTKEKPRK